MTQNSDDPQPILIERGSYITHCGYVGEDKTELSFRTPKTSIEAQFKHIFLDILKVDPAQHKVVIIKDAGTAQQVLREEAQILFTKFHVMACAFGNAQVGIIFSWVNKDSHGLILDIGYKSTIIVPIIELMTQMDFGAVIPMAGSAIEQFIIDHLLKHGIAKDFIENHREQLFPYLMRDYYYFDSESEHDFEKEAIENRKNYLPKYLTLNDKKGKSIELSLPNPVLPNDLIIDQIDSHKFSFSAEINNQIIKILETFGIDYLGSLIESDHDPYTNWWAGQIIITGGASNILGLRSLLIRELLKKTEFKRYKDCERALSSPLVDLKFRDIAFTIRNVTSEDAPGTWLGASIIFSLKVASRFFVTRETYLSNSEVVFPLDHKI